MRIPKFDDCEQYFHSLGYSLTPGKDGGASILRCPDPAWEQSFNDVVELWIFWLKHAAHIINDYRKTKAFMSLYKALDTQDRKQLMEEMHALLNGGQSQRLKDLFLNCPTVRYDALPRRWRQQLQRIMNDKVSRCAFPYRIDDEIAALK